MTETTVWIMNDYWTSMALTQPSLAKQSCGQTVSCRLGQQ